MSQIKVNPACGDVCIAGEGWLNLDYASSGHHLHRADLLGRLLVADNSAGLVCSSHFLEQIPRSQAGHFFREIWRILRPGGVLRLVTPDLENLCRTCLSHRDRAEHKHADLVVLELLDQFVKREPGSVLGCYYQNLKGAPQDHRESITFVRERTGKDLLAHSTPSHPTDR